MSSVTTYGNSRGADDDVSAGVGGALGGRIVGRGVKGREEGRENNIFGAKCFFGADFG